MIRKRREMITSVGARYGHLLDSVRESSQSLCDDDLKKILELAVKHVSDIELLYRDRLSVSLALPLDVLVIIFGFLYRDEKRVAFWSQLMGVSRSWCTQIQQSIDSLITSTRIVSFHMMNRLSFRYPRLVSLDMFIEQSIDFTLFTSLTSLTFKQDRRSIAKIGLGSLSVLTNLVTLSLPAYVTRIDIEELGPSIKTRITDLTLDRNNDTSSTQINSFVNLTRLCVLNRNTCLILKHLTRLCMLEVTREHLPYMSGYTGRVRLAGTGYCMEGVVADCKMNGLFNVEFRDGDHFDGNYIGNVRNGHGIYRYADGTILEGDWWEGVQHGKFIRTTPDGKTITERWLEGVLYK